jgi:hypothetical protein
LIHPLLVLRDWDQDRVIFEKIYRNDDGSKPNPVHEIALKIFYTARGAANRFGLIRAN